MATTPNPIASAIGTVAGGAVSGPLSIVSSFVGLGKDLIDRFVPDPAAKLQAQQHLADQAAALQMAQIDQQNQMMKQASANIQADPHMSGQRAYFCGGITTLLLLNYTGITGVLSALLNKWAGINLPTTFAIPASVLSIFAVIMLGFVGIPAALQMVQAVAGMPGESQIKLPFGLGSLGNKS